jgi:large subunit ribosomal protein L17
MFRNMVTSLLQHERIVTTAVKAKEISRLTEKMITLGKRGDLHARRQAVSYIRSNEVVKRVFSEYALRYASREGGYTRVLKLEPRAGDNAPMALLELVDRPMTETKDQSPKAKEKAKEKEKAAKKKEPKKETKAKKEPKEKKAEKDDSKSKKKATAKKTDEKEASKAEPKKKAPAKKKADKED